MIVLSPAGSAHCQKIFKINYNIASVLGYATNIDDDLSAAYNANPSQVAFGHLGVDT